MKRIIIICIVFLLAYPSLGQKTYPIKEVFDQVIEPHYSSITDYNDDISKWWESWGWNLLVYIRMYQATGDKAYLNKFVKHSYNIQTRRSVVPPIWLSLPDDGTRMLYTGILIRSMAEFVHLVKTDIGLYNTNILQGVIPLVIDGKTILGYGDYVNWLELRITQTLNFMIGFYWIDDNNCFRRIDNGSNSSVEINFQAFYATTMFYIGNIDPINNADFTHKAEMIVNFFRNRVTEFSPNQSYTWFHNESQDLREDVSHAGIDIQIPFVAYKLYGSGLYQPSEMNKFAHTFTFNIWDRFNVVLHNNVFGTDTEVDPAQKLCGGTIAADNGNPNFYAPGEVLTWMQLYPFDDAGAAPNDIYTVLITQAVKLLQNDITALLPPNYCNAGNTSLLSGAQSFYGLSEVVKAQWDKECVNLSLFNRRMVYSQDFHVKNKLIVEPLAGTGLSFADPVITTPEFTIEPGVTVNMTAGEEIRLKPGFRAKAGSEFRARIVPSSCSDGMSFSGGNSISGNQSGTGIDIAKGSGKKNNNSGFEEKEQGHQYEVMIMPNPNTGKFTISPSDINSEYSVSVADILGHEIFRSETNTGNMEVDLTEYPKGIYFVKLTDAPGNTIVKKVVFY